MNTGGGDGYQSRADQEDASIVYTCSQQINCVRLDLKTGISTSINPQAGRGGRGGRGGANGQPPAGKVNDPKLRSRWDIPFIISPHNHTRLYIAGQPTDASDDSGATWKEVSADLTRNIDRDTIPVMGKVWANGRRLEERIHRRVRHRHRAGGIAAQRKGCCSSAPTTAWCRFPKTASKTWRKMDKWPGVPDMTYVTDVHPSPVDVNTLFVTLNDFQRGNFKPTS